MENTPEIRTSRLLLRRFTPEDAEAFYQIMSDKEVNTFLPWFPMQSLEEAAAFLQEKYLKSYEKPEGFRYAVCLLNENVPIGYVNTVSYTHLDVYKRQMLYGSALISSQIPIS